MLLLKQLPISMLVQAMALMAFISCVPLQPQATNTGKKTTTPTSAGTGSSTTTNNAPVVATAQIIAVVEDTATSFSISPAFDLDGDTLSYSISSAPSLGTLTNCMNLAGSSGLTDLSCTYTPGSNSTGNLIDSFSYSVSDGTTSSAQAGQVFFSISAVNDSPTITASADTTISEGATHTVSFVVDEGGGSYENSQALKLQITSSNATLVDETSGIKAYWGATLLSQSTNVHDLGDSSFDASSKSTTLIITPISGQSGATTITISVSDDGGSTWATSDSFILTVSTVDNAPTFVSLPNGSALKNAVATTSISVDEGGGSDEDVQSVTLTITSGNPVAVPDANISINTATNSEVNPAGAADDSASAFSVTFTPAVANYTGSVTFTATINDGTSNTVQTFTVSWLTSDTVSTIADVTGNQTVNEDTTISSHQMTLDEGSGSDEDSQEVTIRITSSDTTILPVANIVPTWNSTTLTGTVSGLSLVYPVSDGTTDVSSIPLLLNITPASNQNGGPVTITVEVSDDAGGTYDATATFDVTFTAVDDDPTFVSLSNQTVVEGASAIFTITADEGGTTDEDAQTTTLRITTGDATVTTNAAIIINAVDNQEDNTAGAADDSGVNFSVQIDPDANTNYEGSVTFTADLSTDGGVSWPTSQTFTVTWTAVNDVPTVSAGIDETINEDASVSAKAIAVDEAASGEDSQSITIRFTSSNSSLVDVTSMSGTWNGNTITNSGGIFSLNDGAVDVATASFLVTIPTVANANGSVTITVEVSDDGGSNWNASDTFDITVNAVNDIPTITTSSSSTLTTNIDTGIYGYTSGSTTYGLVVSADEGGGSDEDAQALTFKIQSSNTTLLPYANIRIYYGSDRTTALGAHPYAVDVTADGSFQAMADAAASANASTLYIDLVPATGVSGSSTVTLTVQDDGGGTDTSSDTVITFTVNSYAVSHNGWDNIKAVGAKVDTDGSTILNSEDITVSFSWNAFSYFGGASTATSWNVYRSEYGSSESDFDFTTPLSTVTTKSYTDSSLTKAGSDAGKAYWYKVRPIISGVATGSSQTSYNFLRIIAPPDNMALVHRWQANISTCSTLGQTTEPANNFRCPYTGPGNINVASVSYYDFENDLLVDRFELGCNYTTSGCSTGFGCIGTSTPNGTITSTAGDLFYNRSNGQCYVNTDGATTWERIEDRAGYVGTNPDITNFDNSANNSPGLPPFSGLTQLAASTLCQAYSASLSIAGVASTPAKRLLKRKEQVQAARWSSSLSTSNISTYETGSSLSSSYACNSANASSQSFTDLNSGQSTIGDVIPGMLSNSIRSLVTGSSLTANCVSFYGLSDMVGNVSEWTSDRIYCTDTDGDDCTGVSDITNAGKVLESNNDSHYYRAGSNTQYAFDGITGPCADSDLDDVCDEATSDLQSWTFYGSPPDNDATKFFAPMGLPADNEIVAASTTFTIGTDITQSQLRNDELAINALTVRAGTVDTGLGGMLTGGDYASSGDSAGVYSFKFDDAYLLSEPTAGLRCAVPVP